MSVRTVCSTILLAAVVAVSAAGCVGPAATPSASPSAGSTPTSRPSPTPTPMQTPTATATAEPQPTATAAPPVAELDPAYPGTWLIDFSGIGPLTLGTPLSEVEAALPEFDSCRPGVDLFVGNSFVASVDGSGETVTLALMIKPLDGAQPHTAEGITIGSTLAELQSTYPDLVTVPKSFNEQNDYSITDGTSWIHFDTYGQDVVKEIYVWNSDRPVKEYCG